MVGVGKQDAVAGDSDEAAETAAAVAGKVEPVTGMGLAGRWKMGQSEST